MRDQRYVWVVEIGIFAARGDRISHWEPWVSFNTRGEAVEYRDTPTKFSQTVRERRAMFRIVKYVPAQKVEANDGK